MKRLAIVLCLLLATSISAADAPAGEKIYRIMPVGDSITEGGKTFANYRLPLLEKLTAAGYRVEFVGSRKSESRLGPLAHEGYGGRNAEFLATVVGKSFHDHPADIVLIHAGHNHFADEKPVDKIFAATEAMVDTFRKANPRVIILLAQVIPSGKLPKYAYIPELNAALAKLAGRLSTTGQPVLIVNQAEGFDFEKDTIDDKVHPNTNGAEKMAAKWYEALSGIMEKPKR